MDTGAKIRLLDLANFAVFAAALVVGGVLFFALPQQSVSLAEKRRLAPEPQWSAQAVLSGRLFREVDDFYADHFIFRDTFVGWADVVKSLRGPQSVGGLQVIETNARLTSGGASQDASRGGVQRDADADLDNGDYANIRSVIIYKNRAVQIATGSNVTAARFAAVINLYHRVLGPDVVVYCMPIPVGSDFYLPHAVAGGRKRELENITQIRSDLEPGVVNVDAYTSMSQHTSEYIEYRTDHHWTALGAYYAYRSFAASAGFTPLPLSAMTRKTIPGFLGSLYYYTRSEILKQNLDEVDYYKIPYPVTAYIYSSQGRSPKEGHVYEESAKGGNAYGVFIGGDHPLTQIVSPNSPTQRKIVIIKDSFGNAFAPYLAAHYREVWVVDYRYFRGDIVRLMRDNDIHEILFAHNTYVVNGRVAVVRAEAMLHGARTGGDATQAHSSLSGSGAG